MHVWFTQNQFLSYLRPPLVLYQRPAVAGLQDDARTIASKAYRLSENIRKCICSRFTFNPNLVPEFTNHPRLYMARYKCYLLAYLLGIMHACCVFDSFLGKSTRSPIAMGIIVRFCVCLCVCLSLCYIRSHRSYLSDNQQQRPT